MATTTMTREENQVTPAEHAMQYARRVGVKVLPLTKEVSRSMMSILTPFVVFAKLYIHIHAGWLCI